jgi:hypothetical protein
MFQKLSSKFSVGSAGMLPVAKHEFDEQLSLKKTSHVERGLGDRHRHMLFPGFHGR